MDSFTQCYVIPIDNYNEHCLSDVNRNVKINLQNIRKEKIKKNKIKKNKIKKSYKIKNDDILLNSLIRESKNKNIKTSFIDKTKKKKLSLEDIIAVLPDVKKKKALLLLQYILNQGDNLINWNDQNEIILNGQIVEDSNILEIIKHTGIPNMKLNSVTGMEHFYNILSLINTPTDYISNKIGKQILNT